MFKRTLSGLLLCILSGALAAHAVQFLEAPQYPTGTNPQAVAVGDFNGDGNLDFAVANSTSNTVTILLGNGDGTFTAQAVAPATGSKPLGIAAGDFNGDGNLDLAVTNSSSNTVSILLGNGDGTFQAKMDYATGKGPQGVAVADFNGDGNPDLAITNATDGTVLVLLNKGKGTFPAPAKTNTYISGFNPVSIAAGDFNNDGIWDLAVANDNNNAIISVFLGNGAAGVGNGTFQGQLQYPIGSGTGHSAVSIAVGDFNGDKNLDIAVADQQGNAVSILLGKGNGGFAPFVAYPTAPFPTGVTVGDLDGDGNPDVAVSAGDGNAVTVLWGVGDGTFQEQVNAGAGDIPYSVVAGVFVTGGNTDLAVANSGGNTVSVILSNGKNRTFQARADYSAGPTPYAIATADFRSLGIQDIAVANNSTNTISILLGNGDGTFQGPTSYSTGSGTNPHAVVVGDFNGDGHPDLAVANYATGTIGIMLGNGNGTFGPPATLPVGLEPAALATGDFNGDGKADLVVANFDSGTVSVLLGNGDGTFKPAVNYTVGSGPVSVAAADFSTDNILDLVVVNEGDNDVSVLLGNGNGTFQAQKTYSTGTGGNPLSVMVQDFNNDGNPDLAVADFLKAEVSVLLGNGDGTFQIVQPYPTGGNPSSIVIWDFNGDNNYDLALACTPSLSGSAGNVLSLLTGVGNGTFNAPTLYGTGFQAYSQTNSAALGDFNGDGAEDVVVANSSSNTVSVLLNIRGTAMTVSSSPASSSYGESVTFTATVAASVSNGVAPTGTVTVQNGTKNIFGSGKLANGEAAIMTSALPVGADQLSVVYSGDANYQSHTIGYVQPVIKASSTTALASSANPSAPGQTVTFTATVTSSGGLPTGTVTFYNAGVSIGTSPVNGSGIATFPISTLAMGTNAITADYNSDGNFQSSNSLAVLQIVGKANTSTTLSAVPANANLGQSITLTATVTSAAGTPTGTVSFMDGGTTVIGTPATLNAGIAMLSTSTLTAGTHSITADYSGDVNDIASTSSSQTVSITAPGFSFTPLPTLSSASIAPGSTSTATVTITPLGGLDPSTVTLSCAVSPAATPAATCSLGAISVANNKGTSTLTVSTTGAQAALAAPAGERGSRTLFALGLMIPAMLLGGAGLNKPHRRKLLGFCLIFLVLGGCIVQAACSSSGSHSTTTTNPGTPAGTYMITVSGTASGVQTPPPPISLSLTVQ